MMALSSVIIVFVRPSPSPPSSFHPLLPPPSIPMVSLPSARTLHNFRRYFHRRLSSRLSRRLFRSPFLLLLLTFFLFAFAFLLLSLSRRAPAPFSTSSIHAARRKWPRQGKDPALQDELWHRVKHDVVIGIKTGHEVAPARLKALRTVGWWSVGRDVPNVIVIGDSDHSELGVVGVKNYAFDLLRHYNSSSPLSATAHNNSQPSLPLPSHWFDKIGWRGDKDKNLPALHLMRSLFPHKKWYLLLDDDTYIFLENFARYILIGGLTGKPIYTGKVFYISRCGGFERDGTFAANHSAPKGMFAHGGSGIFINNIAMDILYPRIPSCIRQYSSCWAGDIQVGLCLRSGGVTVHRHGRSKSLEHHFIPFWPSKALADRRYSKRWKSDQEPITFHKIPEREQQLMSELERRTIQNRDIIVYNDLRRHLLGNGIIPCNTSHNRKTQFFSTEFMPHSVKLRG